MRSGKRSRPLRSFAAAAVLIMILFSGLVLIGYYWGNINKAVVGCAGIELFYTNTSLAEDYFRIVTTANFTAGTLPGPPAAVWNGEPVDCDTISNAIMCLSELYDDSECAFYTEFTIDQTGNMTVFGHLGVKCRAVRLLKDGSVHRGNWIVYY